MKQQTVAWPLAQKTGYFIAHTVLSFKASRPAARVVEWVDARDSKSRAARRAGSIPVSGTLFLRPSARFNKKRHQFVPVPNTSASDRPSKAFNSGDSKCRCTEMA